MIVERIEVNGHELTAFDLPPEPSETYEVHVDGLGEIVVEKGKPPKEKDVPAMYMRKLVPELCEQNAELHRENAKLRELMHRLISHVEHPPCEGCGFEMNCDERVTQCDEWQFMVADARELGVEV